MANLQRGMYASLRLSSVTYGTTALDKAEETEIAVVEEVAEERKREGNEF